MPELMVLVALVLWIALLVWVYRDATRRGMSAGFWMGIIFLLHLIGFIAYLIARGMRPLRAEPRASASPREPSPLQYPPKFESEGDVQ